MTDDDTDTDDPMEAADDLVDADGYLATVSSSLDDDDSGELERVVPF